jgi:hypothetical protein
VRRTTGWPLVPDTRRPQPFYRGIQMNIFIALTCGIATGIFMSLFI